MIAEIQRLENAARLSMGTFNDNEQTVSSRPFAIAPLLIATLAALPLIAVLFYY